MTTLFAMDRASRAAVLTAVGTAASALIGVLHGDFALIMVCVAPVASGTAVWITLKKKYTGFTLIY